MENILRNNKMLEFLKKSRILKRPTTGQFIGIGVGLVVAAGLFFFSRFRRLLALDGSCGDPAVLLRRAGNQSGDEC